ncbi:uncharacterized protein LOC128244937 [Mya arenaria]|uniref:uncharacterized protein LOC128244937 n=1 Tax=Mya arenaria TaxID=6604 RepID=UPI0022E517DC|nr:uncharacterized protein LOC128244937 [Mya arenaria]
MMASTANEQESTTKDETVEEVGGRKLPQCQPCSKNNRSTVAQLYCNDCKEFQCSACSAQHQTFALLSGHAIVDWKLKDPEEKTVNMFGFDKCLEHGNPVTIFCEDHEVFCCPTCGFSGHRLCEKAKQIKEFSVNVTEFQERLKDCNAKASLFIKSINEIGNAEIIKVNEKAETLQAELIQKISRDLTEALKEIQTLADALKSSKEEEMTKVSNIKGDLELWRNSLNAASEQGSHDQCFILCKSLKQKSSEYNEFLNNQSYDTIPISANAECHQVIETFVKGDEKLVKLLQDNVATGSEVFEEKSMTTRESFEKCSTDTVENIDDNQREQTVHLTSMAISAFTKMEKRLFSGIDFLPDGRLLVVDNKQNTCFLLDENCKVLGNKLSFFNKNSSSFDVCVYRGNRAVVTSVNYLYFLQIYPQNSIRLIQKVNALSYYFSITSFNHSMFLCSTYIDDNGPVRVVDLEGNETRFIDIGFPDIKYGLGESFSTYISIPGIIVLTDKHNNKVHLFHILTGWSKTVEDDRFQWPTTACVAPDGTVFVSCEKNNVIVRISLVGEVLQVLKISFKPKAVRISRDGKLAVAGIEGEHCKIHLYQLDYR